MTTGMLGVNEIEIGNVINDPSVDLLRDIKVETAVTGFHVEDWNMQPLGHVGRETGVGVTKDKQCIRFFFAK